MKNEMVKYVVVLGVIAFIAAAILHSTYNVTKAPIAEIERKAFLAGLEAVLPEFDNDPNSDAITVKDMKVYVAKKNGQMVGYAVEAISPKGYGGSISVLVGATMDGSINNIKVVSHLETPGLGDKITNAAFTDLFRKKPLKNIYKVKADGGEIDQFSGATVSPRAVCDAVNQATPVILEALGGGR